MIKMITRIMVFKQKSSLFEMINDDKKRKTINNKSSTSSKSTYQKLQML